MNTHEFISSSSKKELEKIGYDPAVCHLASEDAVDFYKRSANFKKGALTGCIDHAKKKAKQYAGKARR